MIRRSRRPTEHFTILRNDVLRDTRLSFRARGLLAAILSRPDNWTIRSNQLCLEGKEGRDAIRSALSELAEYGYLHVEKVRMPDGTFATEQVIFDYPEAKALVAPEPENPASENQASENQASVFQASLEETVRSTNKEETKRKTKSISSSTGVDAQFDQFWEIYPRKVGKGAARKAWKGALKKTDATSIIDAVTLYRITCPKDPQYIAHPASWLNAERWADETDLTSSEPTPAVIPHWEPCDKCAGGWLYQTDDKGYEWAVPCQCRP